MLAYQTWRLRIAAKPVIAVRYEWAVASTARSRSFREKPLQVDLGLERPRHLDPCRLAARRTLGRGEVRDDLGPACLDPAHRVEIWFSILQGQSLHGASFTSVKQLREHIDAFIKAYNTTAAPFAWTKSEVHQKRLKPRFAHQ